MLTIETKDNSMKANERMQKDSIFRKESLVQCFMWQRGQKLSI